MRLQIIENELLSVALGKMKVSQYFNKVKSLYREINCNERGQASKGYEQSNASCFVYEKQGHNARDYWFKKEQVEGNVATPNMQEKYNSEKEWNIETSIILVEQLEKIQFKLRGRIKMVMVILRQIDYEDD